MKFTRLLTALALGLLATASLSSMAGAQCDPLAMTTLADINADGVISVTDVVLVVGTAFRNAPPSRFLGTDDLNGDGVVNVTDVVLVVGVAFRNQSPVFAHRAYSLTGRSGPGSYTLIADDSIQYRFFGIYEIGEDRADLGLAFTPRTDTIRIQPGTDVQGDTSAASPVGIHCAAHGLRPHRRHSVRSGCLYLHARARKPRPR